MWAIQVVHLCLCMYLNQLRDRDDVLDFKRAIDAGFSVHCYIDMYIYLYY
jgi:hypothetical protein